MNWHKSAKAWGLVMLSMLAATTQSATTPQSPRVTFDGAGYRIDGRRDYLVSGEFHYFRVPKADWRRRMELAKAAGMNTIATYVPWIIHEPVEGKFVWSDRDERDLRGFLKLAQETGLMVIVRPGPYQYSELRQCGLPAWVLDKKELRAKNAKGDDLNADNSVSYNHPEFLRLVRRYYHSFAEQVKPFMQSHGGPVVMVQLDNEITGVHDWFGGHDHNPVTFGIGREDGYFATWLQRKYGALEKVNAAYGTAWKSFAEAAPIAGEIKSNGERRRWRDFRKCYLDNCGEYVATLRAWLKEDGIDGPHCCNCANADMNNHLRAAMKRLAGSDVLFGSDHYYTLGIGYPQEAPTIKYAMTCQRSLDTLGGWGFPPTVFEMPAGSISAFPGLFRNDLLACYMLNFVYGMKGVNYYVYTGGPNFEGTGGTCDVYDYNAPIAADGTIRETYLALKDFGSFLATRRDLADSQRLASVAIGVVPDTYDGSGIYGPEGVDGLESGWDAMSFTDNGFLYSLSATPYTAKYVDLTTAELDPSMPLALLSASRMDAAVQRKVADFVLAGGALLVAPVFPTHDWDLNPCTILADALGALKPCQPSRSRGDNVLEAEGERMYGMDFKWAFKLSGDATEVMRNAGTGETIGYVRKAGKGKFCQLGTKWTTTFPEQTRMLAKLLARLGAKKTAGTDSLNLPAELHRKADGSLVAFILNLHASPQTAKLEVWKDGKRCFCRTVRVEAMQVLPVDIPATAERSAPQPSQTEWPFAILRSYGSYENNRRFTDRIFAAQERHPGLIDEIWFAGGSTFAGAREDGESAARDCLAARDRCRELGIAFSYQQGVTLNHGPDDVPKPELPEDCWAVDNTGKRRYGMFCCTSPFVKDYLYIQTRTFLELAHPDSYWPDDDLRLFKLSGNPCVCFCDRCLKLFNERYANSYDRAELLAALNRANANAKVRRDWCDFNGKILGECAASFRRAADEVAPETRLGIQIALSGNVYDGKSWQEILRALAGKQGRAGIRPGGGYYNDGAPDQLVDKMVMVAREAARSGKLAECGQICYEAENWPHVNAQKSPGGMMAEGALALAAGCDSLALYWGADQNGEADETYDFWFDTLAKWKPFLRSVRDAFAGAELSGIALYHGANSWATDGWISHEDSAISRLAENGLPISVTEAASEAYFLNERAVATLAESDLGKVLARPVLLDYNTFGALSARFPKLGLSRRLSVVPEEAEKALATVSRVGYEVFPSGQKAECVKARLYPLTADVKPLSRLSHDANAAGTVVMPTAFGGSLVVVQYIPTLRTYWSPLHWAWPGCRRRAILDALDAATPGKLSVRILTDGYMVMPLVRKRPDGSVAGLLLMNLGTGETPPLEVAVRGPAGRKWLTCGPFDALTPATEVRSDGDETVLRLPPLSAFGVRLVTNSEI